MRREIQTNVIDCDVNNVSYKNIMEQDVSIHPNPCSDAINIEGLKDLNEIKILIYNQLGETVLVQELFSNQINVTNLPSGVYFLKVQTSKEIHTQKFMKQ